MAAITIRNVPDPLYRALVSLARRNHRSLQQQALLLLEHARLLDRSSPLDRAAAMREALSGRELGDTVAELRKERRR